MDRLDTLAIFVEVAEQASFVKAATRLGRSPAAVSRAVAVLEARLGTGLLRRTTRAVTLTDDGLRYLEKARALLAGFEDLEATAASEQSAPRGLLSLTVPVVFGRLHVLPVVGEFLKSFPEVRLRLLMLDRNVSLVDEGIDIGVRLGPLSDSSIKATRVGHVTRGIYASPAYLKHHAAPQTPDDLGAHQCIAITAISASDDRWTFGRRKVSIQPRLTLSTIDAGVEAALMGLGLVRLHSYQADRFLASGALVEVLGAFKPDDVPIHVIQPALPHVPAKTRAFIDRLVPALRAKFN